MNLARNIGLRVPDASLFQIGPHEIYLVERFDRRNLPERVARVHQEDFCQALGIMGDKKYQVKGGPGFDRCRSLIDEHLAMSVGKTFRYDRIGANSLTEFAKDMKFRPVKVAEILQDMLMDVWLF
jgi:serine/threonine protein kinase HipA of HipAB toxin-antitoxin module